VEETWQNRDANLEIQVKALVAKALQEQGVSTEPRTLMCPPGELALVGSPPDVPSSQGSNATTTAIDRIREPTSCILGVLIGRQNMMIEVGTGVAHPPGGLWHNNAIPQDYTRVKVHTMKPEFRMWKIDHPTPEGLDLLGDVVNQFILWHKKDIVLITCSLTPTDVHLERVVEDREVYSPARDDDMPEMPHSSPNPSHHMPQPSPARTEQRHDVTCASRAIAFSSSC
jgi:hypothetical protein